jgi:hypothetical protein
MKRLRTVASLTTIVGALWVTGCSRMPNAPVVTGDDATGSASTATTAAPAVPLAADSATVNAHVSALTGGVVQCGPYRITVPPAGLDRDVMLHLQVSAGSGELEVHATPGGAQFLLPYRIQCDMTFGSPLEACEYSMWWWDDPSGKWRRMGTSAVDAHGGTVRAFATGPGRFVPMPWAMADPLAPVVESAVDVSAAEGGVAACGDARLVVPPGAVRGDATVAMAWDRSTNVVDLEITPTELNGFETPVELSLPAPGLTPAELATAAVYWWNPDENQWESVEGSWVDPATGTVHAPLRHFSRYTTGAQGKAGWRNLPEGRPITD